MFHDLEVIECSLKLQKFHGRNDFCLHFLFPCKDGNMEELLAPNLFIFALCIRGLDWGQHFLPNKAEHLHSIGAF